MGRMRAALRKLLVPQSFTRKLYDKAALVLWIRPPDMTFEQLADCAGDPATETGLWLHLGYGNLNTGRFTVLPMTLRPGSRAGQVYLEHTALLEERTLKPLGMWQALHGHRLGDLDVEACQLCPCGVSLAWDLTGVYAEACRPPAIERLIREDGPELRRLPVRYPPQRRRQAAAGRGARGASSRSRIRDSIAARVARASGGWSDDDFEADEDAPGDEVTGILADAEQDVSLADLLFDGGEEVADSWMDDLLEEPVSRSGAASSSAGPPRPGPASPARRVIVCRPTTPTAATGGARAACGQRG